MMEEKELYAVIFTSKLRGHPDDYGVTADRMVEMAKNRRGFVGVESARGADGVGITVSYWDSLDAIAEWRDDAEHKLVQARGRDVFYERYSLHVARVLRSASFP